MSDFGLSQQFEIPNYELMFLIGSFQRIHDLSSCRRLLTWSTIWTTWSIQRCRWILMHTAIQSIGYRNCRQHVLKRKFNEEDFTQIFPWPLLQTDLLADIIFADIVVTAIMKLIYNIKPRIYFQWRNTELRHFGKFCGLFSWVF